MIKVYMITNTLTSNVYVGITKQKYLSRRMWEHANRKGSAGSYLHSSIKKYGQEHFTMELLAEVETPEEAKLLEQKYIKDLKLNICIYPNGNGMNMTDGGDGSYGYKPTSETKEKYSGKNNHNYGLTGSSNPTSRSVIQYDRTGIEIKRHGSIREAARFIFPNGDKNITSVAGNIGTAARGHTGGRPMTQAYGFKWRYAAP